MIIVVAFAAPAVAAAAATIEIATWNYYTHYINGVRRQKHLAEIPFTLEQLLNLLKRIFGEQIKHVRSGFTKKNSNAALAI